MGRTLLVTNDFPPRPGGIQQFVHNLAVRQPPGSVVVYASTWRGRGQVRRRAAVRGGPRGHRGAAADPGGRPAGRRAGPGARLRHASGSARRRRSGLLADGLRRRAGVGRAVALTHGHEIGWAALPGARRLLRRIGRGVDVVTYLAEYQRVRLARALARADRPAAAGARRRRRRVPPRRRRRARSARRYGLDRPAR